jgi:hypothetical protein
MAAAAAVWGLVLVGAAVGAVVLVLRLVVVGVRLCKGVEMILTRDLDEI